MLIHTIIQKNYQYLLKPLLFQQDAEKVHNSFTIRGKALAKNSLARSGMSLFMNYQNNSLNQEIRGINFRNPIGLAAGFDYDGHLAETMQYVGFGFNTAGTVTAKEYKGNTGVRLDRLPKSKSLLVNKGFKSEGVDSIVKRLDSMDLEDVSFGVSVGSTNISSVNTTSLAIDDYVYSFEKLKNKSYIKYFELNISCPNTSIADGFAKRKNFLKLVETIGQLKIKKPVFVKMANELSLNETDRLVTSGINNKMSGFIFSNLVKDRTNPVFNKKELVNFKDMKGNFSGKPAFENSNKLIKHIYKEYGKETTVIGCGGVFNAKDAYKKIRLGASLVQLITGMIYEGPQIAAQINEGLVKLLGRDGFTNISEAVGVDA